MLKTAGIRNSLRRLLGDNLDAERLALVQGYCPGVVEDDSFSDVVAKVMLDKAVAGEYQFVKLLMEQTELPMPIEHNVTHSVGKSFAQLMDEMRDVVDIDAVPVEGELECNEVKAVDVVIENDMVVNDKELIEREMAGLVEKVEGVIDAR